MRVTDGWTDILLRHSRIVRTMHTRRAVKSEMTLCILLCFVLLKSMFIAGCLTAASDRQRGSEDVRNH